MFGWLLLFGLIASALVLEYFFNSFFLGWITGYATAAFIVFVNIKAMNRTKAIKWVTQWCSKEV